MKTHVQVAIIGGGVVGCSLAYHLAIAGWRDVVLLERSELTAGSTWHAAGGTGAFGGGANETFLHKYSFDLYPKLERETGQSCGFHHVGLLTLARTSERMDELKRHHALARRSAIETHWLSASEARKQAPILEMDKIKGVLFEPSYGHVDPNGVTQAFAKGARDKGVEIHRQAPVTALKLRPDLSWEVHTAKGTFIAERVVNAAGLWAREVAGLAGFELPLMPVEHHYFVTEQIPEIAALNHELPLIGDADAEYYMRQEGDGLLLGVYEDTCTHWSVEGTPANFGHELLPDQLERIERNLEQAVDCVPALGQAGIKRVINGPIMFSPDLAPLIGPVPGLPTYWCACGTMTGFSQAAGMGMVLEHWMREGEPALDVFSWDVARFGDWADKAYTKARTADMYTTRFQTLYPYEERSAGRPVRTTPAYERYRALGAYFGSSDGLEYPLWFSEAGTQPEETRTYNRPNWFEKVGEECHALHQSAGIIDISTYGKHFVRGPGARAWLDHLLANRLPKENGKLNLSPMLGHSGRLMGEFSVARLADEEFLLIGSGTADRFHHRWWAQFLPTQGVTVESATNSWSGFSISGPKARDLVQSLCDADLSSQAWPYRKVGRVPIAGLKDTILIRVAYTGELGFEVLVPMQQQSALLDGLLSAGHMVGARMAGVRALNSLRIEKGFGAWGLEYACDYSPFEADMGVLVKFDKGDFAGRAAAMTLAQQPKNYEFCKFEFEAGDVDPWGGEPIMRDGDVVGYLSSAAYGHRANKSLGLGYLFGAHAKEKDGLCVDVLGELQGARVLSEAAFDPQGLRMRS